MEEAAEAVGEAIVGEVDVNESDLRHAQSELPGAKRIWLWLTLLVGFSVVYLGLRPEPFDSHVFLSMVLPTLFVLALTAYFQIAGRKAWIKQALTNIGGQTTFRFDDYGFSSESKLRQHRLAWGSLSRAVVTPSTFLVYTSPVTVLIVPKRAFTDAQVITLSNWLRQRITAKPPAATGVLRGRGTLLMWVVLLVTFLSIWHFLSLDGPRSSRRGTREIAAEPEAELDHGGAASDAEGRR